MRKSLFNVLGATAVLGATLLTTTAASAAPHARAARPPEPPSDPDTTVTFTVTTGALTMTAPATADLGPGAPGTTIYRRPGARHRHRQPGTAQRHLDRHRILHQLDHRRRSRPAETIPATDAAYDPGTITTTGTITATGNTPSRSPAPPRRSWPARRRREQHRHLGPDDLRRRARLPPSAALTPAPSPNPCPNPHGTQHDAGPAGTHAPPAGPAPCLRHIHPRPAPSRARPHARPVPRQAGASPGPPRTRRKTCADCSAP